MKNSNQMDFQITNPDESLLFWSVYLFGICAVVGFAAVLDLLLNNFKDQLKRIFWLVAIILTSGFASFFNFYRRHQLIVKDEE